MEMKQEQMHGQRPPKLILPGLPGGPPFVPVLPSERLVETEGELVLFDSSDVQEALRQFESAGGQFGTLDQRLEAMRRVMMFTLAITAVNVGVPPDAQPA